MMDSTENERMSVLLSKYMEFRHFTGTQEVLDIDRKACVLMENLTNSDLYSIFFVGSSAEGFHLPGSDLDGMLVNNNIIVVFPDQCIPPHMAHETILYARAADCCPGYVYLQLHQMQMMGMFWLTEALVEIGNSIFVSSEMFREHGISSIFKITGIKHESNGPACMMKCNSFGSIEHDFVLCFPCHGWPKEADEWITRPRLYGWPHQTIIDHIVHRGCHLVPVGDKCSENAFLQWRISFVLAERTLVHSFSHIQFKVYALLKCFLKQIKEVLKETIGDDDILCSYFLKTILFHAIENSSHVFWQEKNFFYCFWYCFNILIAWVRAGYCPNYFIPANNLFKRKVHGQHQQILLDVLSNFCRMKWMCLSVGNFFGHLIWEDLCNSFIQTELMSPKTTQDKINEQDTIISFHLTNMIYNGQYQSNLQDFRKVFNLLLTSQSESDEILTFSYAMKHLQSLATTKVYPEHRVATDNKTRYRSLRKCKNWMIHSTSMGTEQLHLATFHFLTGNVSKSQEICKQVMKLAQYYTSNVLGHPELQALYSQVYHRFEHTSDRLKKTFTNILTLKAENQLYLPHLCLEMSRMSTVAKLPIPPLPYALFLTFLCCQELGDTRGRDAALRLLIEARNDENQGGNRFWIVHNLLGICYQTLGDNPRAIRAYWDSAQSKAEYQMLNPAIERIAVVYLCMYARQRFDRG